MREAPAAVLGIVLVALTGGCATSTSGSAGPLDGVYTYTAHQGGTQFEGALSLATSHDGYQGYLTMPGADLPLVRSSIDGDRVTLAFENDAVTMVLTVVRDGNGLRGSWRSLRGAGSIRATRVSTAWYQDEARWRRPGDGAPPGH